MKPFIRELLKFISTDNRSRTIGGARIPESSRPANTRKHKQIFNECITFLTNNGITVDDDLRRLIEFFFSTDNHLSHDDIRQFVYHHRLNISDTEIRDAFALLVEYGFAIEREFGDNLIRYEHLHLGEHHDHFCCFKCGKIIEFFSQELEEAQNRVANNHGFHAFNHKMQIHGLCCRCFGASTQKAMPLSRVETGGKFRIIEISDNRRCSNDGRMRQRIMEMGIVPGAGGTVLVNHGRRVVLLVNNSRVALGRAISQDIKVTLQE